MFFGMLVMMCLILLSSERVDTVTFTKLLLWDERWLSLERVWCKDKLLFFEELLTCCAAEKQPTKRDEAMKNFMTGFLNKNNLIRCLLRRELTWWKLWHLWLEGCCQAEDRGLHSSSLKRRPVNDGVNDGTVKDHFNFSSESEDLLLLFKSSPET